jgi:hypothetical protein
MKYRKVEKTDINKDQTFIQINNPKWKQSGFVSLELFNELMEDSNNVRLFDFDSSTKSTNFLNLKVDDNFLYVMVKDEWKRVPLSKFLDQH